MINYDSNIKNAFDAYIKEKTNVEEAFFTGWERATKFAESQKHDDELLKFMFPVCQCGQTMTIGLDDAKHGYFCCRSCGKTIPARGPEDKQPEPKKVCEHWSNVDLKNLDAKAENRCNHPDAGKW